LNALKWARENGAPWNKETCANAARGGESGGIQEGWRGMKDRRGGKKEKVKGKKKKRGKEKRERRGLLA